MNKPHELIFVIVNAGHADDVMDAAKAAGAGGGTIIHGHGAANKEAEAYFRIPVQSEKDAVMLAVPAAIRDEVLHAVYRAAGMGTPAQGIAFSLPITDAVGLREQE